MENLLHELKGDFKFMLKLQREYSELNTKLYYIADMNDKRNYNQALADKMQVRLSEVSDELIALKIKWGV